MARNNAKQYAEAIYNITKQSSDMDIVVEELAWFGQQLKDEKMYNFLTYEKKYSNKKQFVEKSFGTKLSKTSIQIILLLAKNKELLLLEDILIFAKKYSLTKQNIVVVKLYSAFEINEDIKQKIKKIIESKLNQSILIEEYIDKDLIGGVKIDIDGRIIDGSIIGRINDLKAKIENI